MSKRKIMDCPDCGEALYTAADLKEHTISPRDFGYNWIPEDSEPTAIALMNLANAINRLADKMEPKRKD